MGFLSTLLGFFGFLIGTVIGLLLGFYTLIYSEPEEIEEHFPRPLNELDTDTLLDLLPDIPVWLKSPDYERVDWLNKFVKDMWPYLDKAVCGIIRSIAKPIFAEYIGKFQIESIEFENLTLGTLPPVINGVKVLETNEKELLIEPAVRWAGNPNITAVINAMSFPIKVQLVDLQVFASPRIALKPLVPTFPCFANIFVSLMEKPHVDFGVKVLGGDIMAIPGLYRYVQKNIEKQVAYLYHWPQTLEIPILDSSTVAIQKPVGILHVKVVRAQKLLKKDFLGTSDPYVKLSLTGERLPAKKTTIKKRNLNPEWNESFKLVVKDPQSQVLQLQVFDWDKVGAHDRLGMQLVPLKLVSPNEMKEFSLELLKNTDITCDNPHDKKQRGMITIELTYVPFKEDSMKFDDKKDGKNECRDDRSSDEEVSTGAGLLTVMVRGAEHVEGQNHSNPYSLVLFRGEVKKTKRMRKTRDPIWNEEFQFMLEEPPLHDRLHVEVMSRTRGISFRPKESLGHVDVNLCDVVHNGRINEKYHLINSRNGVIHLEITWKTA